MPQKSSSSSKRGKSNVSTNTNINISTSTSTGTRSSDITLFLRNLRLLNLDRRDDWPNISERTFNSSNTAQHREERIRQVEWTLYRLFEIWNADLAKEKLQPFFPPLDTLQSQNLRVALHRCLQDLRKNGILNTNLVLKKNTLQECHGEELNNILLAFSTAVLRKVMGADIQRNGRTLELVDQIGLDSKSEDTAKTLRLAYMASTPKHLDKWLDDTNATKQIAKILIDRRTDITQRKAVATKILEDLEAIGSDIGDGQLEQDLVEASNIPQQWIEEIIHGTNKNNVQQKALLGESLEQMKSMVLEGKSLLPKDENVSGLAKQLDDRIQEQRSRMDTWLSFRAELEKRKSSLSRAEEDSTSKTSNHQKEMSPPTSAIAVAETLEEERPLDDTTQDARSDLMQNMANNANSKEQPSLSIDEGVQEANNLPESSAKSRLSAEDLSSANDAESTKNFPPPTSPSPFTPIVSDKMAHLSLTERTRLSMAPHTATSASVKPSSSSPSSKSRQVQGPLTTGTKPDSSVPALEPKIEPGKRRLTNLTERTRESLSILPPLSAPSKSSRNQTYLSTMSSAKRKPRTSQFPVNQFETPSKITNILEDEGMGEKQAKDRNRNLVEKKTTTAESGNSDTAKNGAGRRSGGSRNITPRESLFSEGAEYSSIFKSRPRVAMSPILTPIKGIDEDEDERKDSGQDDSGFDEAFDSPLGNKG